LVRGRHGPVLVATEVRTALVVRLLFIASRFPYPPIGGDKQRVFSLLKQLAKAHEVTLLVLGHADTHQVKTLTEKTGVARIKLFKHTRVHAVMGVLGHLFSRNPLQVAYFRSKSLVREVQATLDGFDVVVCHLIRTSSLVHKRRPDQLLVLDMCDTVSANYEQTVSGGQWWRPWWWVSAIEAPRTRAFEKRELQRFDLTTLVSESDAARLRSEARQPLVITNGIDVASIPWSDPLTRQGRNIALVGKMDFYPNRHGAIWFATHVLPRLPPSIHLKIVGECPPKIQAILQRHPRVIVTGRVPSIADACQDCFVAIAPLHVATGVQTKVLEYFAMGLPSVITPTVASGLLREAKGCAVEATSVQDWIDAIGHLDQHRDEGSLIAKNARRYVEYHHDWSGIGEVFNGAIAAAKLGK
jgi:glycosyltransferase involved in cell wall biosynthesis